MSELTPLQRLAQIVELATEVEMTLAIGAPNPGLHTDHVRRSVPGSRPPTDVAALHASMPGERNGLRAELVTSVQMIIEEMADEPGRTADIPDWPSDTWSGICEWLRLTSAWWMRQPWSVDVEAGIQRVHAELRHMARVPKPLRVDCTTHGCHGSIFPELRETAEGPRFYAEQCENGHLVDRHEAVRRAYRLSDYPLSEIAGMIDIPVKTLHRWAKSGAITPVRRARNAALYNLEAVRLAATRLRRAG
ncbi:MerR family transcriptional regulator [Naumannella halotolerans]|uniref:MerR-like DNA binding protein n=1 Tax=Naumannella halotolerans TaxID=993414 RepID=A0A4R7J443_9ACTN|nr:MerR family transcriptional regulator [Naumannella halotolerans]TDT31113.1 MerR-like DNA binding protein [Naumannella halotolerans]